VVLARMAGVYRKLDLLVGVRAVATSAIRDTGQPEGVFGARIGAAGRSGQIISARRSARLIISASR